MILGFISEFYLRVWHLVRLVPTWLLIMAQATSMSGTETPVSNYPIAMGADLGIVKAQLKEHMVWMHTGSGIDSELVLQLSKDCLVDIRSIYLGSETVAFIDYVPSATMPNPVLAKAGTHTVGKARVSLIQH